MFIEPAMKFERRGWIEVICGSMFSGKTEELIRRLRRMRIARLQVAVFREPGLLLPGWIMDYLGRPFGQMPELLAKAEYITRLHAICMQCWNMANYSYQKGRKFRTG